MASRFRKILSLALVAGVLTLIAAPILHWRATFNSRSELLAKISERDTRDTVVMLMGKPDQIYPCGDSIWWGGDGAYLGKNDGRCVTSWSYDTFLARHEVSFDTRGFVVSKYLYVSE
jgi:hypothetical protein